MVLPLDLKMLDLKKVTKKIGKEIISIPIQLNLSENNVDKIVHSVNRVA